MTSPSLSETVGLGVRVMVVMGPIVLEWPPPQPARKIMIVRIKMKATTADRKYCIDPPHPPTEVDPEIPPEWLKTNSVAAFGESFLGPGNERGSCRTVLKYEGELVLQ